MNLLNKVKSKIFTRHDNLECIIKTDKLVDKSWLRS